MHVFFLMQGLSSLIDRVDVFVEMNMSLLFICLYTLDGS